jgi:hypothetical protein
LERVATCPQAQVNVIWVVAQLQEWLQAEKGTSPATSPERVQVFRPQSFSILARACQQLGLDIEATRKTEALKQWLQERAIAFPQQTGYTGESYDPLDVESPPPQPIPSAVQAESWQFADLSNEDFLALLERVIPVVGGTEGLEQEPLETTVPCVIFLAGRRSRQLVRWLEEVEPVALRYVAGAPDGLVLDAGLVDRWVLATFEDGAVATSGLTFEQQKQDSGGRHGLLVLPDTSGVTVAGLWLLQP